MSMEMEDILEVESKEADFSFEEIFFSTTDERGIITSGNSVFQRVSGYTWNELHNKPHNIIRHPDMPKSVFYLLWDQIKQGNPIGAYVKNKSKKGNYYWVFAMVVPVFNGYLSIRIKPGTVFFDAAQAVYKKALAFEKQSKSNDPACSLGLIVDELNKAGFKSYQEFMATAVNEELILRNEKIQHQQDLLLVQFRNFSKLYKCLDGEIKNISLCYKDNKYVPLNLQINSAQKLEEGKAIGIISDNYKSVSKEIKQQIDDLNLSADNFSKDLYLCQFWFCYLFILKEIMRLHNKENSKDEAVEIIKKKLDQTLKETNISGTVVEMEKRFSKFQVDCVRMKSIISSLAIIRIMGRVELSNIPGEKDVLQELTEDLKVFQTAVSVSSTNIFNASRKMKSILGNMAKILR